MNFLDQTSKSMQNHLYLSENRKQLYLKDKTLLFDKDNPLYHNLKKITEVEVEERQPSFIKDMKNFQNYTNVLTKVIKDVPYLDFDLIRTTIKDYSKSQKFDVDWSFIHGKIKIENYYEFRKYTYLFVVYSEYFGSNNRLQVYILEKLEAFFQKITDPVVGNYMNPDELFEVSFDIVYNYIYIVHFFVYDASFYFELMKVYFKYWNKLLSNVHFNSIFTYYLDLNFISTYKEKFDFRHLCDKIDYYEINLIEKLNIEYLILNENPENIESQQNVTELMKKSINSENNEKFLVFVEHLNDIILNNPELDGNVTYSLRDVVEYTNELLNECKHSYASDIIPSFNSINDIYQVHVNIQISHIHILIKEMLKLNKTGYRWFRLAQVQKISEIYDISINRYSKEDFIFKMCEIKQGLFITIIVKDWKFQYMKIWYHFYSNINFVLSKKNRFISNYIIIKNDRGEGKIKKRDFDKLSKIVDGLYNNKNFITEFYNNNKVMALRSMKVINCVREHTISLCFEQINDFNKEWLNYEYSSYNLFDFKQINNYNYIYLELLNQYKCDNWIEAKILKEFLVNHQTKFKRYLSCFEIKYYCEIWKGLNLLNNYSKKQPVNKSYLISCITNVYFIKVMYNMSYADNYNLTLDYFIKLYNFQSKDKVKIQIEFYYQLFNLFYLVNENLVQYTYNYVTFKNIFKTDYIINLIKEYEDEILSLLNLRNETIDFYSSLTATFKDVIYDQDRIDKDEVTRMECSNNEVLEGKVKLTSVLDLLSANKGNQNYDEYKYQLEARYESHNKDFNLFRGKYKELKDNNERLTKDLRKITKNITEAEKKKRSTIKKYVMIIKDLKEKYITNQNDITNVNGKYELINNQKDFYIQKYNNKKYLDVKSLCIENFNSIYFIVKNLDLSNNSLRSIEKLIKFVNLEELKLSNNYVEEISCLTDNFFKNLRILYLDNNNISTVSEMSLNNIEYLNLSYNQISDLHLEMNSIKYLVANNNLISEFDVSNLLNIEEINLSNNQISYSIIKMYNLQKLKTLNLDMNLISGLNEVENDQIQLYSLQRINLRDNKINNLKGIYAIQFQESFPMLENIELLGNPFMPRAIYENFHNLPIDQQNRYPIIRIFKENYPNIQVLNGVDIQKYL